MKKLQYNILFLSLISFSATMPSQSESKTWYASNYTIPLVAAGSFFLGSFATSVFKYFREKDNKELLRKDDEENIKLKKDLSIEQKKSNTILKQAKVRIKNRDKDIETLKQDLTKEKNKNKAMTEQFNTRKDVIGLLLNAQRGYGYSGQPALQIVTTEKGGGTVLGGLLLHAFALEDTFNVVELSTSTGYTATFIKIKKEN